MTSDPPATAAVPPGSGAVENQSPAGSAAGRALDSPASAAGSNPFRRPSPLLQLTLTRLRTFYREPEALFWVFAFPTLLAVALGLAFREKPPDRIPVAVVSSGAGDAAAATTAASLARSPVLLVRALQPAEAEHSLRTGKVSLLVLPGARPVFRLDETRPDARAARLEASDALERAAGRSDPVTLRIDKVTAPGSRYIDFLIPGLLGMNLMGTGIWSVAFSITTARQRHILKRLVATPMKKRHYLAAQMLSRLFFLVPEMILLVGLGWLAFGVAVHGSLILLFATCLLAATTFCGLGLLIASRVATTEGVSGLANLVMLPMWLLSGVFFSAERFPDRLQPLIRALPLTAVNDALRGIMNEGLALPAILPQLAVLAAWCLISFLVALRIFRWR